MAYDSYDMMKVLPEGSGPIVGLPPENKWINLVMDQYGKWINLVKYKSKQIFILKFLSFKDLI